MSYENNMDNILEEVIEEDSPQYSIDEVNKYVEDNQSQDNEASDYEDEEVDTDNKEKQLERIKIQPPATYEYNKDSYEQMFVPVQDYNHPITQQDKEDYLDAMLQESELQLTIDMKNGLKVTCRDLNMYEREVSLELAKRMLKLEGLTPQIAYTALANIRMPMQIVKCGSKKFNTIRLNYDADATKEQFNTDVEFLQKEYKKILMPIPSFIQSLYSKALNIFEHKLARLEEAAFNEDFWNPVGRD